MSPDNAVIASSIAAAEMRLETMSVLCGILSGRIEASRRDLRQIRSDVAAIQSQEQTGHATAGQISPEMLLR
jgi:hypothetical protein